MCSSSGKSHRRGGCSPLVLGLGGGMAVQARSRRTALRAAAPRCTSARARVFSDTLPLAEVAEAYAAMDQRRATKALLQP